MNDKPKDYDKSKNYMNNNAKYYRKAYIERYGVDPFHNNDKQSSEAPSPGFTEYRTPFKPYWNDEHGVGVMEFLNKFVGVACLVAKEVSETEDYVRKFGLSFKGDIHWKAAPVLLDHLSRAPVLKAVFVSIKKAPFELVPDIPEELQGRIDWATRNYQFHRDKAETLRQQLQTQTYSFGGPYPRYLPKQIKEEEDHAKKFLDTVKTLESQMQQHLKNYFQIKPHVFGAALFFYVYTTLQDSFQQAVQEIIARRRAAKIEATETYFVSCDEVRDPLVVFNPEVFPLWERVKQYYGMALAQDVAGFTSDRDVAGVLRKLFTLSLEVPKEEPIEEKIHIPTEEVSVLGPRSAFLGHVVESVVKRKATHKRVYFPLDALTAHGVIYGKTRSGKSFLALLIIKETLNAGIKVKVFDPHGTLVNRLDTADNLEKKYTRGRADITSELQEIYDESSGWPETNTLKLLIVLDETQLLKARNLTNCLNELGKRGVGFLLITQYATSIPPVARNLGTAFIMAAMSETEIERFREVTLHPSAKLITRLPKGMSFVFSPGWYPEPFFMKHRNVLERSMPGPISGF